MTDPAALSLVEKASLTSGSDFWHTKEVEDIPAIMMSDGPHGLRKQGDAVDHLGVNASIKATCFPPASGLSQSWDVDLVARVGAALGRECRAEGVHVLLGPAMNIKRSPLCGRNFEYFSEDPLLTGVLAAAWVAGIQSEGVGASPKHFAVNNQETDRQRVSADVDIRTLREIYLRGFQRVVQDAEPWMVMCSYNRINGVAAPNNSFLLTDILREEWGFKGVVISDWASISDRIASIEAGLDLEMPYAGPRNDMLVADSVRNGRLSRARLDESVARIADLARRATANAPESRTDFYTHHELAREAAASSVVLMQNQHDLLPLTTGTAIAVIGELAMTPRYQGGGSSAVNPTMVDIPLDEIRRIGGEGVSYAVGYSSRASETDEELVREAVTLARSAEVAVLFLGLRDDAESEGWDRTDIDLPQAHIALARAVFEANPSTVVVLAHGGAVCLETLAELPAILDGGLLGQGGGRALAEVLFGIVNPSGRLSESVPARIEDTAAFLNFPGEHGHVLYGEGLFVGYRWYDAKRLPVTFPFGHGLSYTTFEYSNLDVEVNDEGIATTFTVMNTGHRSGRETAQVYVSLPGSTIVRPPRELKGFAKVSLEAGESCTVKVQLHRSDLAYWDIRVGRWILESGDYLVSVGASSRDLKLSATVGLVGDDIVLPLTLESTIGEVLVHSSGPRVIADAMTHMRTAAGAQGERARVSPEDLGEMDELKMMMTFPIERMITFAGGTLTAAMLLEMLDEANARPPQE